MNSHPGLFSRVRQSKHFLMSRPCVSCPNNRIFFLTNYKLFLVVVFLFTLSGLFHTCPDIFEKGDFFVHCRKKTLPLFLDQTEARRAQKTFGDRAPLLISGSGWLPPPPPLIWRSKSTTELAKHGGKLVSFSNEYVWAWPTKEIM